MQIYDFLLKGQNKNSSFCTRSYIKILPPLGEGWGGGFKKKFPLSLPFLFFILTFAV